MATTALVAWTSILGRVCMARNPDSGAKLLFADVASSPLRSWEAPGLAEERSQAFGYDALRRPTERWITTGLATTQPTATLVDKALYGESLSDADSVDRNLRGQPYQHRDGAGIATDQRRDFGGKVIESTRQLATGYKAVSDWSKTVDLGEAFCRTICRWTYEATSYYSRKQSTKTSICECFDQ